MMLAFILVLSGTATAALASWTISGKKKVCGASDFSLFLLTVSLYCFGYAFEINKSTISGIYDSLRIQFTGISFSTVFFLLFSVKLITEKKIRYYIYLILFIIPVVTILAVFTLEKHDLFYSDASVVYGGLFPVLHYTAGPLYIVSMANLITTSCIAEILLFLNIFRSRGIKRKQIIIVFISGFFPILSAVINPVRMNYFDIQPFVLMITGVILSVAVFRYRMFDLIPYAREIAVDSMKDYFIVFDMDGNVQDFNSSAGKSDMLCDIVTGAQLPEKNPLKRFCDSAIKYKSAFSEMIDYQFDYKERNYQLKISYIKKDYISESGYVFIVSDITKSVKIIKELEYYAIYNSLTGSYNRRHIINLANREINIAVKSRIYIGFILIDIDHFKKVNDTFGHLTGDYVLKEFSLIIGRELRVSDLYGRYGGEEFLVVCPGSDPETTLSIAERLRVSVQEHSFVYKNEAVRVTASFGVFAKIPSKNDTFDDMLRKADIALYNAKNSGRNNSRIYTAD